MTKDNATTGCPEKSYSWEEITFLAGFVDYFLPLTPDEQIEFDYEMSQLDPKEREAVQNLTNTWIEQGREEGLGMALAIVLHARFGTIPQSVVGQLSEVAAGEFQGLVARAATASLEEFIGELGRREA